MLRAQPTISEVEWLDNVRRLKHHGDLDDKAIAMTQFPDDFFSATGKRLYHHFERLVYDCPRSIFAVSDSQVTFVCAALLTYVSLRKDALHY